MDYPVITMEHNIEGRIRVKLSHSIIDIENAESFLKEEQGIEYVRYNPVIKSLLIKFNSKKISVEHVIFKIAVLLSKLYGFSRIKFISNNNKTNMPLLSYYSLISILGANIVKYLSPTTGQVQDFINWLATGTTVGAIVEHGYSEMKQRGTIDPEVMSIMYLINSIGKGNMLNASLVTWITTFGRHILNKSNETFIIRVEKNQMGYSQKPVYDVSVLAENIQNTKMDSFKLFANEIIESQNRCLVNQGCSCGGGINNNRMFFNIK